MTFENHCLEGKLAFGEPFLDSGVAGGWRRLSALPNNLAPPSLTQLRIFFRVRESQETWREAARRAAHTEPGPWPVRITERDRERDREREREREIVREKERSIYIYIYIYIRT